MPALVAAAAIVWAVVILFAPVALRRPASAGVATLVYAASSRICHQRTERSFAVAGIQLPVCARCTGLYLAGAAGAVIGWFRRTPRAMVQQTRTLLALAALPTAVTFALEFAGLMPFSNVARAVAAIPLGLAAGWVFIGLLRYDARFDGNEIVNR